MSTDPGQFDLVSHWRLQAPADRVWAALTDPAAWPGWWPGVDQVQMLRKGDAGGVGGACRIDWSTRLPYRIVIDVEVVESVRHRRLRVRSRGTLDGEGVWLLRTEDGFFTDVTFVWRVRPGRRRLPWLAALAVPLLAPLFRWNHSAVMRAGELGLRRRLQHHELAQGP